MQIGFVGLGQLGARLVDILLEDNRSVIVFDLDAEAMEARVHKGATAASSVSDLAEQSDILITCLPSPAASAEVAMGEGGALTSLKSGSTWIEMSTTSVDEIKKMNILAEASNIHLLEAPMTGGVHRAAKGEMTILVGGEESVFKSHSELLDLLGGQVIYMGEIGSASLIKVITNLLCLVDLVATGEALMLAKKGGLDLGKCYEAICASSGTSREFEDWAPVILNGTLNTGFTTDLGLKDLGFVTDLGKQYGVPLKLTELVKSLFEQSREKYGGDVWTPHVIKMLEDEVGEELRADGFPDVIQS
jgi:3-hydroxyisobutyrate dehydrogenase